MTLNLLSIQPVPAFDKLNAMKTAKGIIIAKHKVIRFRLILKND